MTYCFRYGPGPVTYASCTTNDVSSSIQMGLRDTVSDVGLLTHRISPATIDESNAGLAPPERTLPLRQRRVVKERHYGKSTDGRGDAGSNAAGYGSSWRVRTARQRRS